MSDSLSSATPCYRPARVGGCLAATLETRSDGTRVLRSAEPLEAFPARLADRLEHWAREAPERTLVAKRAAGGGDWQRITYAQMLDRAQHVGQALLARGLTVERPVAILSDNDLEHLTLALGAMWAGIAYVPVSSAYSLVSTDHGKLRHILGTVTPGLVFGAGPAYAKAIAATVGTDVDVVMTDAAGPGAEVLVDWLPWNHTFGGNQNVGIALYNGGTLYIDDGKPTPKGIAETLRNLRELSPTIYFNVPKGFEEIASALDGDAALRETLFRRVKAFMFAGAGLSQAVWDKLDAHAEATVGERIRIITGLGMTETAPSCTFAVGTDVRAGEIGLPVPGVEVKIVPMGDKSEIRFRGPNVMPGYWRAPEQTVEAFDEEGFYRTGDAVKPIDAADATRGLLFDGRIAEDFKLSTGAFVSVGPLRARVITAGAPLVQDAVVAGLNREGTGSANRVARLHVLAEPPSIDKGEITDKGSINQRTVLAHRAALVEALCNGADPQALHPRKEMKR